MLSPEVHGQPLGSARSRPHPLRLHPLLHDNRAAVLVGAHGDHQGRPAVGLPPPVEDEPLDRRHLRGRAATPARIGWSAGAAKPLTGFGAQKVRLTDEFLFFERGMLRTDAPQVPLAQIWDLDATQSMIQKSRDVGNIRVHVGRVQRTGYVLLEDIPDHREGVDKINELTRRHGRPRSSVTTLSTSTMAAPGSSSRLAPALPAGTSHPAAASRAGCPAQR